MRTRTRAAHVLSILSYVFIVIGWMIPFWFGRFYETTKSKKQWGLFYVIICRIGECSNVAGILNKADVDFIGATSPIELQVISVIATLAMALCSLGLIITLIINCHVCGNNFSYHNYVTSAAIVQFVAASFAFLTFILSAIATGAFFSKTPMNDVIEFPWSVLMYGIGTVLLIASAILYLLITMSWKGYRHIYAKKRYTVNSLLDIKGTTYSNVEEPLPDYNIDRNYRYKLYDRNSFIGFYRGSRDDSTLSTRTTGKLPSGQYYPRAGLPGNRDGNMYFNTYPYKARHNEDSFSTNTSRAGSSTINTESDHRKGELSNSDGTGRIWQVEHAFKDYDVGKYDMSYGNDVFM